MKIQQFMRLFRHCVWGLALLSPLSTYAACEEGLSALTDLSAQGVTVRDNRTQLTWMRCSVGQRLEANTCLGVASRFTWQQALEEAVDSVNSLSLGGYSDWRLPNIKELASMTEKRCSRPALDTSVFPVEAIYSAEESSIVWWTSSPDALSGRVGTAAWRVDFDLGTTATALKSEAHFVRLVRGNPTRGAE